MGEFQQYFDVILFAMVAGFLVLRLRSVLGRRTGNERRRGPFPQRAPTRPDTGMTPAAPGAPSRHRPRTGQAAVVPLPDPAKARGARVMEADPANPVADGLMHIRR